MNIRTKLGRLGDPRGGARTPAPSRGEPSELDAGTPPELDARVSELRGLIGGVFARAERRRERGARRGPQPLPAGALRTTPHGELHVVDCWLEPDHHHGRVALRGALGLDSELVAKLGLDPALAGVDLDRLLIVDTETTGLAGGAGTVPFLIGCAFFEDGVLRVEQLLLRNLGEEAPMLHWLRDRIEAASCLLSYNGKSFDWPLLRSRYILNRVPAPACLPPHLDLLHCTRRVLKPRLGSVRLTEVERAVLGFYREDDVDGSLIPGIYRDYLAGEDPSPLLGVIEHNRHDLVALAALLAKLADHFGSVIAADDPRDHLAYARVAARAADGERAQRFAEAAAGGGGEIVTTLAALRLQADLARARGDAQSAIAALTAALALDPEEAERAELHLAIAKLCEHALHDAVRAYVHGRWTAPAEGDAQCGKRMGRLRRKLEKGVPGA